MSKTTAENLTFARWTKGSIDRIYVNGLSTFGVKYWLEATATGDFVVKTDRRCSPMDTLYAADANTIIAALRDIFGGDPSWQQMIDACN